MTYFRTHVHTHTYVHAYMHNIYINTYIYACIHTYIRTYIRTYIFSTTLLLTRHTYLNITKKIISTSDLRSALFDLLIEVTPLQVSILFSEGNVIFMLLKYAGVLCHTNIPK